MLTQKITLKNGNRTRNEAKDGTEIGQHKALKFNPPKNADEAAGGFQNPSTFK